MGSENKKLNQQVEQILDEGRGNKRQVIIRMGGEGSNMQSFIRTAMDGITKRAQTSSARDLVPGPFKLMTDPPKKSRRRSLKAYDNSLASQIAAQIIPVVTKQALKTLGLQMLEPLMNSVVVKGAIDEMLTPKKKSKKRKKEIPKFWINKTLVLNIKKDELRKLPDSVPGIKGIYPNRTLRIPPLVEAQRLPESVKDNRTSAWGIHATNGLAAWGAYQAKGKGINVGLLDTGIDPSHPDLKGKISNWAEFDHEGNQIPGSTAYDSGEHGTHCAGTIVGENHSGQWIGMAPEAKLSAGLVLKGGSGTDGQIQAGIQWAADQGVDVLSMSLGGLWLGPEVPEYYTEAIINCLRQGIPVVVAIGNSGHQTTGMPGNDYLSFAVGATDYKDNAAGFSGGRTHILQSSEYFSESDLPIVYSKPDICAPGVAIKSSVPGKKWKIFNGTSMATPHVAGAIAQLLSVTKIKDQVPKNQRAFLILDFLTASVEELGESGKDHRFGFGRLDILRAIGMAKEKDY